MSLINYASKEITLKIVYYGPGLSGKTTNLQYLHSSIDQSRRGKLLSLATETDRTLFFDFMPMTLGKIGDFTIKFQMYTVPGQVRYNATRKLVLKGVDAIVFVADSQTALRDQNIESYENMTENLKANGLNPDDIPIVIQYNKRDLDDIMSLNILNRDINFAGHKTTTAEAVNGTGVEETFQLVTQILLKQFARKHKVAVSKASEPSQPVTAQTETEVKAAPPSPDRSKSISTIKEKTAYVPPPPPPPQPPKEEVELHEEPEETAPQTEMVAQEPVHEIPEEVVTEDASREATFDLPKLRAQPETIPEPDIEPAPETIFDESSFGARDMPSIEEMTSAFEEGVQTGTSDSSHLNAAIDRIVNIIEQSRIEEWLEKMLYSSDATRQTVSELVRELQTSRKNQEQMIDLLKKIHGALSKPAGKTTKRA